MNKNQRLFQIARNILEIGRDISKIQSDINCGVPTRCITQNPSLHLSTRLYLTDSEKMTNNELLTQIETNLDEIKVILSFIDSKIYKNVAGLNEEDSNSH